MSRRAPSSRSRHGYCRQRSSPCRAAMISRATPISRGIGAVGSVLGRIEVMPRAGAAGPVACPDDGRRPRPQRFGAARVRDRRRRRGRGRGRHGDRQARPPFRQGARAHSRGRHLPHHHDLRRPDDARRGNDLLGRAAVARVLDRARVALPDQEMGGGRRHARRHRLRRRAPARASAPSEPCS